MDLSGLFIPVIIIGLAVVALGVVVTFARNYVKCAPNEVLVVYGRKKTTEKGETGYRLITGGATFVWPIFEASEKISLDTFQVDFAIEDSPNVDGVPVTVQALANLKISSEPSMLSNAVERLLELAGNPAQLHGSCREILAGQLRMIVGTLKIEDIIKDREKIAGSVLGAAKTELNKLGIEIDIFVIQKIADKLGYIESLGKQATAEVKRDAAIGEAEATRDSTIKTAEANRAGRVAAALATQEAETAEAKSQQAISDANRQRDEQIAANDAIVQAKRARIEKMALTAAAEEDLKLRTAQVEAERAETIARTALQAEEKKRNDAHLDATVIVEAERQKQARLIAARAEAEAAVLEGEALRVRQEKDGEGKRAFLTAEAEGRKAKATADLAERVAAADGSKAQMLADAEGTRAKGEADGIAIAARGNAEGEAVKARLLAEADGLLRSKLAEAEGVLKMNEALASMSPEAMRYLTLVLMPLILEAQGTAGEKVAGAIAEPIGRAIGAIDDIRVIDFGGGSGGSGDGNFLTKLLAKPVEAVTELTAKGAASGIDLSRLVNMLNADPSKLLAMLGNLSGSPTPEVVDDEAASA